MKTRSVFTMAIAASLLLALVVASSAGAAPVVIRSGAPLIRPMGLVRAGPPAIASRAVTRVAPQASFAFGIATRVPGSTFLGSAPHPLTGRVGGMIVAPLPTAPLAPGVVTGGSQFAPTFPRVVLEPAGIGLVGLLPSGSPTTAAVAAQEASVQQAQQAELAPLLSGTSGVTAPLNQFPLSAADLSAGESVTPLDQGALAPNAVSVPTAAAPAALTTDQFLLLPEQMPLALPPGGTIVLPEAGVVPAPSSAVSSLSQVVGITDAGLPVLP